MGVDWSSYYLRRELDPDTYNSKKIGPNRHPPNHWDHGIGDTFDNQLRAGKSSKPHLGRFGEERCVFKNSENHCEMLEVIF